MKYILFVLFLSVHNEKVKGYGVNVHETESKCIHCQTKQCNHAFIAVVHLEDTIMPSTMAKSLIPHRKSQENESVNTSLTFFEGENAILPCPFDVINSFWEKNDNILISDNNQTYSEEYRIIHNESQIGHSLEIINITTNDSGLIKCTRNSDLIAYRISLLVTNRPDVRIHNLNNRSLYCNTTGLESIDTIIKWEHRSVFDEQIRYFNSSIDGYLNLDETGLFQNYEMNGIYICVVENKNGTVLGNASSEVRYSGNPVCIGKQYVQSDIHGGGQIILVVSFYSVPEYNYIVWTLGERIIHNISRFQWYEKKTNISTHMYNSSVHLKGYVTILKIKRPTDDDLATYAVYINNTFGSCNCTVQLQELPSIHKNSTSETDKNSTSETGKQLPAIVLYLLSCSACVGVLLLVKFLHCLYTRHQRQRPVIDATRQDILDIRDIETTREADAIQLAGTYSTVVDNYEETPIPFTDEALESSRSGRPFVHVFETQN